MKNKKLNEAQLIAGAARAAVPLIARGAKALVPLAKKAIQSKAGKMIGNAAAQEAARTGIHGVKSLGKAARRKISDKLNTDYDDEEYSEDFNSEEEENDIKCIIDDAISEHD